MIESVEGIPEEYLENLEELDKFLEDSGYTLVEIQEIQ